MKKKPFSSIYKKILAPQRVDDLVHNQDELLKILREDLTLRKETLDVQKEIRDQNARKELADEERHQENKKHNINMWRIAKAAEVTFLGFATPYYLSQYLLHYFPDEFLAANPLIKYGVLMGSFGLGAVMIRLDLLSKLKFSEGEITKSERKTVQPSIKAANENNAKEKGVVSPTRPLIVGISNELKK